MGGRRAAGKRNLRIRRLLNITPWYEGESELREDYTHKEPNGRISYTGSLDLDYDGEEDAFNSAWLFLGHFNIEVNQSILNTLEALVRGSLPGHITRDSADLLP